MSSQGEYEEQSERESSPSFMNNDRTSDSGSEPAIAAAYRGKNRLKSIASDEVRRIRGRLNKTVLIRRERIRKVKLSLNTLNLKTLEASFIDDSDDRPHEVLFAFVVMYIKKLLERTETVYETNFDNADKLFQDIFPLCKVCGIELESLYLSDLEYEDYLAFSEGPKIIREAFNVIKDTVFYYTVMVTTPFLMTDE